jgi:hypothetical protein
MSTGSELAIAETRALSKELSASSLLPLALRKKPEDVLAVVLTGQELGLAPMTALRAIHIIEGKPSMSADLMVALVKKSPACEYLTLAESTGKVATYKTKRKGEPGETVMSFTIEQARAAGALSKANWQKYPDAMLRARAAAAICRAVYPDVCLGIYDADSDELDFLERAPSSAPATGGMAEHAAAAKEQFRAQVSPPKGDVVDGEVVPEPTFDEPPASNAPVEPPKPPTFAERIAAAKTLAELQAIVPDLKSAPLEERTACRAAYTAKHAELSKPTP